MSDSTFVLYHGGGCADGFAAAWAASLSLGRGPDVVYVPMNYNAGYPPEIEGGVSRIFILDFSFPRETMLKIAWLADQVVCLDHHASAQQALEGLDGSVAGLTVTFDMGKSGAMLAWEHFHPGEPAPTLIRYVQDRDLWTWRLPDSKEFSAALSVEPREFGRWDLLDATLRYEIEWIEFIGRGKAILAAQDSYVATLMSRARIADVAGHRVPVVNAPMFQSEVGDALCAAHPDRPFAAMFSVLVPDRAGEPETRVYSLRSRNGFDVSAVAKAMGGGGHRAAAGFTVKGGGKQ